MAQDIAAWRDDVQERMGVLGVSPARSVCMPLARALIQGNYPHEPGCILKHNTV